MKTNNNTPAWLQRWLFRSVDASSLAVFRILFGALLLFESVNYGLFLCLDCLYHDSAMLFKYHGFEWVSLWPGPGLRIHFAVMAIAALGIMLGWHYRVAMLVYTLCFSYLFLLDQAQYLNHFYMVILFCIIMLFAPAHRYWSMDARRRPGFARSRLPNWSRFWLGAQLEIILIYAGFVKLTYDWLNLEPMRMWMTRLSADANPVFQWLTQDPAIALASYGVIVLHIVGAPLLLWRKTRLRVLCVYAFFHLTNAMVFNIGIFPFLTFAATLMLFDPDWPRQVARWLQGRWQPSTAAPGESSPSDSQAGVWRLLNAVATAPASADPASADAGPPTGSLSATANRAAGAQPSSAPVKLALIMLISAWLIVQLVVPLRHFVAPGPVSWNEDGHRFSWRMKLRSKKGTASFAVIREDGQRWTINPRDDLGYKQAAKMVCIPDLIWQYAQYLETEYNDDGRYDVAVHAEAMCSLNSRKPVPLIRTLVDLTAIDRSEPVTRWTWPLAEPLPRPFF